jgi:cobalt-zinc-cadmium efflux system membrane fusion protein
MKLNIYVGLAVIIGISTLAGFFILSAAPRPSPSDHHGHDHGSARHSDSDHDVESGSDHGHEHDTSSSPGRGQDHEKDAERDDRHGHAHDAGAKRSKGHEPDHDAEGPDGHDRKDTSKANGSHSHDNDEQAKEGGRHGHDHDEHAGEDDGHGHDHDDASKDAKGHEHDHDDDAEGHDGHGHDHGEGAQGPHGGKLLAKDGFEVEVSIFEKGVPPRFRVYCYEDHKPVDPKDVKLTVALRRLGDRVTKFRFKPKNDYLHSDTIVEEPHSFDVEVMAEHHGKKYEWDYSQIEGRIHLRPEVAEAVGIQILPVGPARILTVLELPGEVALNADRVCHVVPRVSGVLEEARKNLGDRVKEGEVIAVIESRELANAKSNYLVRLKREELARINYDRIKNLWEKRVSPEKEFLDAQKSLEEEKIERVAAAQRLRALGLSKSELADLRENPEKPMTRYELRAPFDGVVITKHMAKGEWVGEKADILNIADLSTIWVDITVYANALDAVRTGQPVKVKSNSTNLEASGVISYIGPLVGEETRTAMARVVLENPERRWRPGMFVTVTIIQNDTEVPLAVLNGAVQKMDRFGSVVFVNHGDQFEVRPVELGRADSKRVEVLRGLEPGEKYVAAKSFVLKSELSTEGLSHTH